MNIYDEIVYEINDLKKSTEWFSIGKTKLKRDIVCFKLGSNSGRKILLQGCIHAREYITSYLLIKMINYLKNFKLIGQIYIIPLSNPDGLDICINGTKNLKKQKDVKRIKTLLQFVDKSLYKANANAVDLNTNFDADWGKGKYNNSLYPWTENFIGFKPNSESEIKAIINFTKIINPDLTLSYHSKGNVIYYGFNGQSRSTKLKQVPYLKIRFK